MTTQEITGIEDETRILQHLSSHQWDLETAVQDALNEREGRGSVYGASSSSGNPSPVGSPPVHLSNRVVGSFGRHREQAVVRREGWLEWGANLAVAPLRFILSGANELFQLIGMSSSWNPRWRFQLFCSLLQSVFSSVLSPPRLKIHMEMLRHLSRNSSKNLVPRTLHF